MTSIHILARVSPGVRSIVEQHADECGATALLFEKLFRNQADLIRFSDAEVERWNTRRGCHRHPLQSHPERFLNVVQRLIVAVRLQRAHNLRAMGRPSAR